MVLKQVTHRDARTVPTATIPAKRVVNFAFEPEKFMIGAIVAAPAEDDEEAADEAAEEDADDASDEAASLELAADEIDDDAAEEAEEAPEVAVEFPATLAVPTRERVEAEAEPEEAIFIMNEYVLLVECLCLE